MYRIAALLWLNAAIALLPGAAWAEGVIEINQAIAEAGGISASDPPGFPVEIREPGSYRLSGDLFVATGADGILIDTTDVTLDLNGFRILGSGCTPSGDDYICTATATSGVGIMADRLGIAVRNGTVQGFEDGVEVGDAMRVRDLHLSQNSNRGLTVDSGTAERVNAESNGGTGLWSSDAVVIIQSVVRSNAGNGMALGSGLVVDGSQAEANGGDGIETGSGMIVRNSTSIKNASDGIEPGSGVLVISSTTRSNSASGISFGSGGYVNNVLSETRPTVGGTYMSPNLCNGAIGSAACQ